MRRRAPLLLAAGGAHALCEPYCSSPCTELNGDVEYECADCASNFACRPGAYGWPASGDTAIEVGASGSTSHAIADDAIEYSTQDLTAEDYAARLQRWRYADSKDPGLQQNGCAEQHQFPDYESGDAPLPPPAGCASIHYSALNRSSLLDQHAPLIITGLTEGWLAHDRWGVESLRKLYGSHAFKLTPEGNTTINECLDRRGYNLAHAELDGCYDPHFGAYSPSLLASIQSDYAYPELLQPPNILQMSFGWQDDERAPNGLGVPPEAHGGAWLAQIKGRKVWSLHPPGTSKPCPSMVQGYPLGCKVTSRRRSTRVCEHNEGEAMWVPEGWWHETCTRGFSIAIGALTTLQPHDGRAPRECREGEYTTADLPYCSEHACPGLESFAAGS